MIQKIMTPLNRQGMTDGQINKAVDVYRSMLRKHSLEFDSKALQKVLGQSDYITEQVLVLRRHVEKISDLIVRHVSVDRTRTPQEALDATKHMHTDKNDNADVITSMPHGKGEEVDVFFFKLSGREISDNNLEKEYKSRGLYPADPYSQAAVNELEPLFSNEYPNGTHWKDAHDNWCFATFCHYKNERDYLSSAFGINYSEGFWSTYWWFAGLLIK